MALASSPRKHVVPLATGDGPKSRRSTLNSTVTKRVFYCGVVVEGSENGRRLPDEIQDLVLSLGNPLVPESSEEMPSSNSNPSLNDIDKAAQRKRALLDPSALASVITELITSERSYVSRLQTLKHDYADPLRNFARNKDTAIIPLYESKTLFGNIDNLLPVNEAFLTDLEKMAAPNGFKAVGGIGDVALRHFKELRGFEQYKQYYVKREDAQTIFEKEMSKRSSRFASYIDHIKYQASDSNVRIGLRELLMEPVQRIPRYTLLFRRMLKHMPPDDPQRDKIVEADEIASKIAQAEADEQTKRAAIFYCLSTSIDGFPPDLFSNSRKFIDCIDVEDILSDASIASAASSTSSSSTSLHCTLFLFDDKLLIVKRSGNGEKGGKSLSGLDAVDKVTKAGGIPTGKKKSGMSCKGVVDIADVVATDIGGADINFFLENPPQDQTERWSGRPFRSFSVVVPPMPYNLDPALTESEKQRFLENLWRAQATYRARAGQSVVLCSDDQEVDSRAGRATVARTYFNVYQRTAFLQEAKKSKVVVHIDKDRHASADPLPFGQGGPPFVVIRVQLLEGAFCRYSVRSSDPNDEGEEDTVQTGKVASRVVQTIHQFGLFEFKTGRNSLPSTPTARSKVAIFGLDAISRNLFNSRPGSAMGDFFAGSLNGHKRNRSRSMTSRSSTYTQTTTTIDSMKSSNRSNSTATVATTMSTMDDDTSFLNSQSSKGFKNRNKSSCDSSSDSDTGSPRRKGSSSRSHSRSSSRGPDYSDIEDDNVTISANNKDIGSSDYDLAMQLEIARKNSLNQHGKRIGPIQIDIPVEATIYEEEPPFPLRTPSRLSKENHTSRTRHSRAESPTKLGESPPRTPSQHSSERRPIGPRSPSPLPPKNPQTLRSNKTQPFMDEDHISEPVQNLFLPFKSSSYETVLTSDIKRRQRMPFASTANTESTPKSSMMGLGTPIEPLSIKKKTSVRGPTTPNSPTPIKKIHRRNSPLHRTLPRAVSPRTSPHFRKTKQPSSSVKNDFERIDHLAVSTKDNIESSRRTIKRLKLQANSLNSLSHGPTDEPYSRPSSPDKGSRSQPNYLPMTKEAQQRLEEMRNLIGLRQGEGTPRSKSRSTAVSDIGDFVQTLDTIVIQADTELTNALSNQDLLLNELSKLASVFKERAVELERAKLELQNSKRQCELVKSLLADATTEKEIMYEAFNEELDGMFNDANLPDDEAWQALSKDLRQTKEDKNSLSRENSHLKRKLAELELEKEEWGDLLRHQGLVS